MNVTHRILNRRGFRTTARAHKGLADVPGPNPFPIVGCVPYYLPVVGIYDPFRMQRSGLEKFKKYGPVIKESTFGQTILFLFDPHDIEKVSRAGPYRTSHTLLEYLRLHEFKEDHHNGGILCSNGKAWEKIRTTFQKDFTALSEFIKPTDELISDYVGKIMDPSMKIHLETDFLNVILCYSCDVLGLTLFGDKWNALANFFDKKAKSTVLIDVTAEINFGTLLTDHGRMWRLFPTPWYNKIKKFSLIIHEETKKYLDTRVQNGKLVPKDEITLMDAWISKGKTDYKELLTFLADLILAGIDTVGYSLSFIMYHISVNMEVQEKLYKELCSLDPDMNTPLTSDILKEIKYLKKVVKESQRLLPLVVGVGRTLHKDLNVGGYDIPEKTVIVTMNQVTCRLPEYVEYPNDFIPERYDADSKIKKMHPFTALPFGHGPRACIGRRLAEQNMYIFLFRMFRNYHVKWNGPKELDQFTKLLNKPDVPLLFTFTRRTR